MLMALRFLRPCLTAHFDEARLRLWGHSWTCCQKERRFPSLVTLTCNLFSPEVGKSPKS